MPDAAANPRRLADRYVLLSPLGEGGASVVWRARDERLGVERAVKLLHPRFKGKGMRRRLEAEARAMAHLEHRHVLRVYDVGEDDGRPFVVMSLAGRSLSDVLRDEGPQPAERVVPWVLQALSALASAHSVGIVHRDVKPQNLLLNDDEDALLADFGIALLSQGDHERATRTGVAMGSLAYMAPEQRLDARSVGPSADLYAAGATLYHLLTGASSMDLFVAEADSPRWQGVAPALQAVLLKATRYEPAARFADARSMGLALTEALRAMGMEGAVPEGVRPDAWPPPADSLPRSATAPPAARPAAPAVDFTLDDALAQDTGTVAPPMASTITLPPDETMAAPAPVEPAAAAPPSAHSTRWLLAVLAVLAVVAAGIWRVAPWQTAGGDPSAGAPAAQPPPATEASADGSRRADDDRAPGDGDEAAAPDGDAGPDGLAGPEGDGGAEGSAGFGDSAPQTAPERPASEPSPGPGASRGSERRPASSPAPPEAAPSGPPPAGRWTLNYQGRAGTLILSGPPSALTGRVRLVNGELSVVDPVRGRYDAATRTLTLRETGGHDHTGVYTLVLSEDGRRLSGDFRQEELGVQRTVLATLQGSP